MLRRADLKTLPLPEAFADSNDQPTRRTLVLTTLLASLPLAIAITAAKAGAVNPSETAITLLDAIRFLPQDAYVRAQQAQADIPVVTHDDLRWADGIAWGTANPLWQHERADETIRGHYG